MCLAHSLYCLLTRDCVALRSSVTNTIIKLPFNSMSTGGQWTMDRVSSLRFLCLHTEAMTWTYHTIRKNRRSSSSSFIQTEGTHHGDSRMLHTWPTTRVTEPAGAPAGTAAARSPGNLSRGRLKLSTTWPATELLQVQRWRKKASWSITDPAPLVSFAYFLKRKRVLPCFGFFPLPLPLKVLFRMQFEIWGFHCQWLVLSLLCPR